MIYHTNSGSTEINNFAETSQKSPTFKELSQSKPFQKISSPTSDLSYAINILSLESLDTIKEQRPPPEKLGKDSESLGEINQLSGKVTDPIGSYTSETPKRGLRSLTPIFTDHIVPNIRKSLSFGSPRSPEAVPTGEVRLLRSENTRLQHQVEELRNQTYYLEVEVKTLRRSLNKSEETKEIQKVVMKGLERQVRVLEAATLRLPELRPLSSKRRNSSLPDNLNEVGTRSPLDDYRLEVPADPRRGSVTFSESAEFPDFGPHKVILLGSSGVGKSSFIKRLCDDVYSDVIMPSFGLDFKTKVVNVGDETESLQLWDTAGQDRFRKITQSYISKVHGLILMYDITSEESFKQLHRWMCYIKKSCMKWAPICVIGNKFDLHHRRCVTMEMGRQMAEFYGGDFAEVSAKNGTNVEEVARNIVRSLMVKRAMGSSREYLTEQGFDEWEEGMSGERDFVETLCSCCIM